MIYHEDTELRDTILNEVIEKYCQDNTIKDGRWRFSDLGYPGLDGYCRKKCVWHHFGVPGKKDKNRLLTFARGHLTEEKALQVLSLSRPIIPHPFDRIGGLTIKLKNGGKIGGRMDYLVYPNIVGEIKSVSADAILKKPYDTHICQLLLNMEALSVNLANKGIDETFITGELAYFPEGREFNVKIFKIPYQAGVISKLIDEAEFLQKIYGKCKVLIEKDGENIKSVSLFDKKRKEIVPIIQRDDNRSWPCVYHTKQKKITCEYYDICWPE